MKSVMYWYQFFTRCEELVPILHAVKITKCEIYGSTKLYLWLGRLSELEFYGPVNTVNVISSRSVTPFTPFSQGMLSPLSGHPEL